VSLLALLVVSEDANCVANAKREHSYLALMESRDLVSVSSVVSRPNFGSLGLEGYKSRLLAYCLETLNIARIHGLVKLQFNTFFLYCICR